jgi:hypothetical protein
MNKLALMMMVVGIVFFMVGMNGIDNAWNLPSTWMDTNYFGDMFSKEALYVQSMMTANAGFLLTVLSSFFLFHDNRKVTTKDAELLDKA